MKMTNMARMKTPREGSLAKVCTEVSTPERTRKVPSSESEKVRIASRMVQTLSALRFPITMPSVKNIQATSVHGRTQRAQAASILPSISAAIANENEIEKPT